MGEETVDLQEERLREARNEELELSYAEGSIDEEIRNAAREGHERMKQAARGGGDVLQASAADRVQELKARKERLPYERWAKRIEILELEEKILRARIDSMHPADEQLAELGEANKEAAAALERQKAAQQAVELAVAGRAGAEMKLESVRQALEEYLRTEPEKIHLIHAGYGHPHV